MGNSVDKDAVNSEEPLVADVSTKSTSSAPGTPEEAPGDQPSSPSRTLEEPKPAVEVSSKAMQIAENVIPGTEHEVILQAFNWESHKSWNPSWWTKLKDLVPELAELGFTSVWLPPPYASLAPQGYLPQDLYSLNSSYGSEDELRSLIWRLGEFGIKAIADIVVNHRAGSDQDENGGWTRFSHFRPAWDERAVTSDTGGKGTSSTGEVFEGVANIDHTQEFVRRDIKAWMQWLKGDVGFSSFRFDFAKGYSPEFVREYLEAVQPHLTIGEYWDTCNYTDVQLDRDQNTHRQRIVDWIDGTMGQSAAFDFTTKAILQEAVRSGEWERLRDEQGRAPGLVGFWPSRAVTFVDNHDTGSTQAHWPFPEDQVLQGYAYILTHPGIPSVFLDHLYDWGHETRDAIKKLLKCRKEAGIACNSPLTILQANEESYVAKVGDNLIVEIGSFGWVEASQSISEKSYGLVVGSDKSFKFAVWISKES